MKLNWIFILLLTVTIISCSNEEKAPDVSHIKIDLQLKRFDHDFFAIDTTNIDASLDALNKKYPNFLQDYLFRILAIEPQPDSVKKYVVHFIRDYKSVKDSSDKVFANMNQIREDVEQGLRYVKYYFPNYKAPSQFLTFIGPFDAFSKVGAYATGDIITYDAIGAGLQLHMGKDYSFYKTEAAVQLFPAYASRRFEPEYIPVNAMYNIIDDMYPAKHQGLPLVEQMIEAGKRLYVLDHLLPEISDTLKTGYTKKQLDGAYENEQGIWSFFLSNDLIYTSDPNIVKDYMNDAPNTQALGPASPGFIGQFVGWQIVKKWMSKKEKKNLDELMKTAPKQIFEEAKYRPD
jgi:hypothetical protein